MSFAPAPQRTRLTWALHAPSVKCFRIRSERKRTFGDDQPMINFDRVAAARATRRVCLSCLKIRFRTSEQAQPSASAHSARGAEPIGQAPQAVNYVPNVVRVIGNTGNAAMTNMPVIANLVPEVAGAAGLQPISVAGEAAHFTMVPVGGNAAGSVQAQTSERDTVRPGVDSGARSLCHRP